MCLLTPSKDSIIVDVKVNAQNAHLEERCVGKYLVDTVFRQMCWKILRVHIFKTDVQRNAQQTLL